MSVEDAFWAIHEGLPRQAPGSDESTCHLLELAGNPTGNGLEIGCGQGRATLLLVDSGIELIATDTHQPFLDELEATARSLGVTDKLTIRNIAMEKLDYPGDSFDLIWAEGAAYLMGLKDAMSTANRLLRQSGLFVITECCWLTDTPSQGAREFWDADYPDMPTPAAISALAIQNGFEALHTYTLPKTDWDNYYLPMKDKVAELESDADEDMQVALAMAKREMGIYESYSDEYGYVGFVLKRR